MKRLKMVLISLVIILGTMFLVNSSGVYAVTLKNRQARPYNGDNMYDLKRETKTYHVVKIYKEGTDTGSDKFPDAIYCLRGGLGFGNGTGTEPALEYTLIGNMMNENDRAVIKQKYNEIIRAHSSNLSFSMTDKTYNSILWIIDNMYLPRHKAYTDGVYDEAKSIAERTEMKDKLLTAAGILTNTKTTTVLTDDDIEVIQQVAIWQYTNADQLGDTNSVLLAASEILANRLKINDSDISGDRSNEINDLYNYLVNTAKANESTSPAASVNPEIIIEDTNPTIIAKTIATLPYYLVGPFEIKTAGDVNRVNINPVLTYKNNGITGTLTIDNETGLAFISDASGNSSRDKELKDMVNAGQFYIAINKVVAANMKELKLEVSYSYWKTKNADFYDAGNSNQPVVIVEKEKVTGKDDITAKFEAYDLALRKFIIKINDTELKTGTKYDREPTYDSTALQNGTSTTATYTHPKNALPVETGDKVVYIIRIYNEGEKAGRALEVKDYLPAGLKFIDPNESTINTTYGWTTDSTGKIIKTEYLADKAVIPAFNKTTGELKYVDLQIECEVVAEVKSTDTTLRNIAEISNDDGDDRDSTPNSLDGRLDNFNPSEFVEDDDDYEDLVLPGKAYDLALRKYITKISDSKTSTNYNREPEVNVDGLVSGETTATYTHDKTPILVKTGDRVTYSIKVFNEGDIVGKVLEITDYLPDGLRLSSNSTINTKYGWKMYIVKEDGSLEETNDNTKATVIKTEYLKDTEIAAFNKGTKTIDSKYVEVECDVIAKESEIDKTLRNIAEITKDDSTLDNLDRDSVPNNVDLDKYNPPADNSRYQEDDDDYEDLVLPGKTFDLALRKFIAKINDKELTGEESREPKLDLSKLRNRTATTTVYTHSKEPLTVKQGDIVTYKIRVYNEGDRDGYASEITDYLPEGLGLLKDYKTNFDNAWKLPSELPEGSSVINLIGEKGLYKDEKSVKNLKLEDFEGITSLKDVQIVAGKVPVTTNLLKKDSLDDSLNLIKAYDSNTKQTGIEAGNNWQQTSEPGKTDGLYYRDVEVTCIVLAENTCPDILVNIAEITEDQDQYGDPVTDRDSTPGNVDKKNEDDDDYEQLILKYFDLALKKFITEVEDNGKTTKYNRVPVVTIPEDFDHDLTYTFPKDKEKNPVEVANSDIVTYTLRIYNEGTLAGYAEEIKDDIPEGLEFLPGNSINKKYEWKMYYKDENGNLVETEDVKKATTIRTDYLSSAKETETRQNELKPFDNSKEISATNPDYKDVQVAFKVIEPTDKKNDRIIINTAEISKDSGNDEDSTPDNDKPGEDDIDKEYIYVKPFDLALIKWVSKAIVTVDGKTTTTNYTMPKDDPGSEYLVKVSLDKKKISSATVKFAYKIKIINEGEIGGYATEITDYLPEGLEFVQKDNPLWEKASDGKVTTRALEKKLLQPGESAEVEIVLTWKRSGENLGLKTNWAEISEDYNEKGAKDIDSTPGNNKPEEDDQDFAKVILERSTGGTVAYIPVIGAVLVILATGVILIKKYVLS